MRFLIALLAAAAFFTAPQTTLAAAVAPQPKADESFDVGTLHVDRYGHGEHAIVLIPGLGCGPWTWYGEIARWSPKYTVYALTLPGFDGRAPSKDASLFDAFDRDAIALLDSRHIEQPVVVGHSLGGTLAIYLAEQHADRLRAIVAADGLPIFPTLAMASSEQRKAAAAQAAASYANLTPAQTLQYEENFMQSVGTVHADTAKELAAYAVRSDNHGVAAWLSEDLQHDLRPNLSKITIPLLEIMPYDASSAMAKQYTLAQTQGFYQMLLGGAPHATVVPVENARHFAMIDQPAAFDRAIETFFGQVGI